MQYIDSNIIIRLIANDVPDLTDRAVALLETIEPANSTIIDAVITEVCFVLEFNASYRLPRSVIYDGLYAIFDSIGAQRGTHTDAALDLYVAHPKLDYVDSLLHAMAGGKQAALLTFDKQLLRQLT